MDWDDLRCFIAIARGGGLSSAARELGISAQTAGRRAAVLEASLGVPLFIRHPSGYRLTDDGRAVLLDAEKVEATMRRLHDNAAARGGEVAGVVRLAAPETLTTNLLLPGLRPFLDRYPSLTLEVVTGIDTIGIAKGEADIALRLVRPDKGALTIRKVGQMAHALYGASTAVIDHDHPRLIGWSASYDLPARRWLRERFSREPDILVNSLASQRAAIQAGIGIGMLPCFLGRDLVALDAPMRPVEPLWLIAHATETISARTRLVYDELASILATNAGILDPED